MIDPVDKTTELCELCRMWSTQIKTRSDEEYAWLEDGALCIVVQNPYIDRSIELLLENDGEFILFFAGGHCHYCADEEDFRHMKDDIRKILENQICMASICYGSSNKRLGEAYVERSELHKPYTDNFSFVLKHKEFRDTLSAQGGRVEYLFWDPKDDVTIKI